MVDILRKRNDTTPLYATLTSDGTSEPLTDVQEVRFFMKNKQSDSGLKVDGTAQIADAEDGVVRYRFDPSDVDESGFFIAEWEVRYDDGTILTFPDERYLTLEIIDDLG